MQAKSRCPGPSWDIACSHIASYHPIIFLLNYVFSFVTFTTTIHTIPTMSLIRYKSMHDHNYDCQISYYFYLMQYSCGMWIPRSYSFLNSQASITDSCMVYMYFILHKLKLLRFLQVMFLLVARIS